MRLLDLVLPQRCVACRLPGDVLCTRCRTTLPRLPPPLCARCGAPTVWPVTRCSECSGRRLSFASARAAVAYEASARVLVAAWKERGVRVLAPVAADLVAEALPRPRGAAVVAVPPDPERVLKRGHHPAARLADELAARWELPPLDALHRVRPAGRQAGLGVRERRRNVAGAFVATCRLPTRVVLVDDVYTTGATASAAAAALRRRGAREVHVVTFARTVRGGVP
jgi:predicted amidophosphoribosyltransferase